MTINYVKAFRIQQGCERVIGTFERVSASRADRIASGKELRVRALIGADPALSGLTFEQLAEIAPAELEARGARVEMLEAACREHEFAASLWTEIERQRPEVDAARRLLDRVQAHLNRHDINAAGVKVNA